MRRTNFARGSERIVQIGIRLGNLKDVYEAWSREEAEAIDVVEAVGRYLETLR